MDATNKALRLSMVKEIVAFPSIIIMDLSFWVQCILPAYFYKSTFSDWDVHLETIDNMYGVLNAFKKIKSLTAGSVQADTESIGDAQNLQSFSRKRN